RRRCRRCPADGAGSGRRPNRRCSAGASHRRRSGRGEPAERLSPDRADRLNPHKRSTVVDQPASDGLIWQPITPADLDDLDALLTAIEHLDEPSEQHSMDALADTFAGEDTDPSADSLLGRDGGGMAVAYVWNHPATSDVNPRRVFLTGGVHPGWRSQGLGR